MFFAVSLFVRVRIHPARVGFGRAADIRTYRARLAFFADDLTLPRLDQPSPPPLR